MASPENSSTRIAIRGFSGSERVFEEIVDARPEDMGTLATEHALRMVAYEEHMVEIEFLDDPGEDRFFRFGTSPEGMVMPMRVDL